MRKLIPMVLAGVVLSGACASQVNANDGGLAYGGTPGLLKAHPSVAMRSEVVRIAVGEKTVKVDCRFVFQNLGPACQVRMGFPDEGFGDVKGGEQDIRDKPVSSFNSFKSSVDGVPVATTLIKGKNRNGGLAKWQAKNVSFGRNQRRIVRDVYTVDVGGQIASRGYYSTAAYTLHSGASWRGNIERSEVIVTFDNSVKGPLVPVAQSSAQRDDDGYSYKWSAYSRGTILYAGPSRPTVRGRSLRWVRANWQPTIKDDVFLIFNYQSETDLVARGDKLPYFSAPTARLLSTRELKGLSAPALALIRNSIYARRGRPFANRELARFFGEQSWYRPRASWTSADDKRLSAVDRKNVELLLSLEKSP